MTPWVQRLLIANAAMFLLQITMPDVTSQLSLRPALALMRPWTLITYMFLHGGLGHIFFNMLALFFFGPRVESRLGSSRFFSLYFISGITGAIGSLIFARHASVVGASGAVFGVMLAFAYFWPRDKIMIWGILPLEARWLVIFTTLLALFGGFSGVASGTAHFAHLGGYVGAYLYLLWNGSARGMKKFNKRAAGTVAPDALANWKKVDTRGIHQLNRDEVNRILDKISASGIGSLSPQEKVFLSNFVPLDDRMGRE
jgi:membrane associated rhomboid family serine protease